eukprot:Lithocolla_globosa_v1_NODE_2236_length_2095_cov_59.551471.p3 type:complete len:101 gc:universal NODE_2236_length_2095_cov_59.551471:1184-882(-)
MQRNSVEKSQYIAHLVFEIILGFRSNTVHIHALSHRLLPPTGPVPCLYTLGAHFGLYNADILHGVICLLSQQCIHQFQLLCPCMQQAISLMAFLLNYRGK